MFRKCKVLAGAFVAALGLAVPQAHAALVDRGGGMLYDTVMNITWLQDANYAKTSGYCVVPGNCFSADGEMRWTQANTWANNLNYGGYSSGWRLARNSPVDGTPSGWNFSYSNDGSTDIGLNITSPFSELSHMYYVNLGLKGYQDADGTLRSDFGIFGDGFPGSRLQADVGLVKNLQSNYYWSGTAITNDKAWYFDAVYGLQGQTMAYSNGMFGEYYAWAVRDGDVAVVPVPGSVALLAGGLALLGVVTRRRKPSVAFI
ncbi:MAG: PEP-CTERM sorting domain-containing protein [Burkholderiales bacterium]